MTGVDFVQTLNVLIEFELCITDTYDSIMVADLKIYESYIVDKKVKSKKKKNTLNDFLGTPSDICVCAAIPHFAIDTVI